MASPFPRNENQRLEALRRYQILDTPGEQAFDDFSFLASTICHTPIALMTLVDADRQWIKARVGLDVTQTPRDQAFCAHTILGTDVMVVEDATSDVRFASNPLVTSAPAIRFYAGAPLIDHDGFALGALCVIDNKPRRLDDNQSLALEALARQIIAQLELRRTSADLARSLQDLKMLHGLLPMCSHCKGIRDDSGYWNDVESYILTHSEADLTHGICPACLKAMDPALYDQMHAAGKI